jgi:hypothetical protein
MDKIIVDIRPATVAYPKFVVVVRELKFDTIRQSEGYVTKVVREYRLRRDAEKFAQRFGWTPESS